MIDKMKKAVVSFDGSELVIGFADITFSFPNDTLHPCLSVRDAKYGLVQPLKGRTVATIPEIQLALRQGADIVYHEAFVVDSLDGFIFRDALKHLIDKRDEAKKVKDQLRDGLYKLIVNTLYGKTGQGINPKSNFDLRGTGSFTSGFSPVSQAYFATMITGGLRASLASLLVAMDELNLEGHDYFVVSATTDGVLYKISTKNNPTFSDCLKDAFKADVYTALESGDKVFKTFEDVDPVLYEKLLEFPALRLLQHSRKAWGYDEFIEIKHAVNSAYNIKTRGQIGAYSEK